MKKSTKFLSLALAGVMVCGFAACNNRTQEIANDEKTIEIRFYSAGYGSEWLHRYIENFEAATDYDVEYREIGGSDSVLMDIRSGSSTVDLYMCGEVWNRYIDLGSKAVAGYDYCLEPLDDVYNYTPAGESQSIGDKMWKEYKDYYTYEVKENGEYVKHQYAMPWISGLTGLFYNKTVFTEAGLTGEPRTTDELLEYCKVIGEKTDSDPLIYSQSGYMQYLFYTWWTQYETLQGRENFYNGVVSSNSFADAVGSLKIFEQDGIYSSLYAMQELLDPAKGFTNELVASYDYMTAQARFIKGDAAIIPNGDWIENEMKMAGSKVDTEIMPMTNPINSAISDKLSYWAENTNYMTAIENGMSADKIDQYDAKLRALVDYVDGVTTEKPAWATETDVSIISEARKIIYTIGPAVSSVIPVYANAKAGAKEFLKYMGSQEAIDIFQQTTNGSILPYNYDATKVAGYNDLSNFAKKKIEMSFNATWTTFAGNKPLVYLGGIDAVRYTSTFEILLGSRDNSVRKTAKDLVEQTKTYWSSGTRMSKALTDAGLI